MSDKALTSSYLRADARAGEAKPELGGGWSFFSNHTHVLICLADNPRARMRDVADRVDITERTVFRLVTELEEADILKRVKEGRRNRYLINTHAHPRHPIESHCTVGDLLTTILSEHTGKVQRVGSRASRANQ